MGHTLTLPSGWKKVKLGDLFAERNEIHETDLELLSITGTRGIIPRSELEGKDNSNCDKSKYLKVCVGDIAYNTMRMWQGVSALSFYEGIVSPAYTVLVPLKETFAPYFSYLFKLRAMINNFYRNSQGLVDDQRSLKYHNFAQIKVTIPPLPEQKRIAEILIEQDKLIALKERLIAAKKKQKKWLMQNLLTGKIRLKGFSGEWVKTKLSECGVFLQGLTYRPEDVDTSGTLVLRSSNIKDNKITLENNVFVTCSIPASKMVVYNDILICVRNGSSELVGKCVLIDKGINAAFGAFMAIFRTENPYFFINVLNSTVIQRQIHLSSGTTINQITKENFEKFKIYLPPSPEQTAIAERLTAADQEIELLTKELEAQKQIKKYLMQQLLTGKIRVTGGES